MFRFVLAFRRIRYIVTPLRGYTSSEPPYTAAHLLLKEKALRLRRIKPVNNNLSYSVKTVLAAIGKHRCFYKNLFG